MSKYFHDCPKCGAHIDPGKGCDCTSADVWKIVDMVWAYALKLRRENPDLPSSVIHDMVMEPLQAPPAARGGAE